MGSRCSLTVLEADIRWAVVLAGQLSVAMLVNVVLSRDGFQGSWAACVHLAAIDSVCALCQEAGS